MWTQLKQALKGLLGSDNRVADADVGMTYADLERDKERKLERDKERKEEQLSGARKRPSETPA